MSQNGIANIRWKTLLVHTQKFFVQKSLVVLVQAKISKHKENERRINTT